MTMVAGSKQAHRPASAYLRGAMRVESNRQTLSQGKSMAVVTQGKEIVVVDSDTSIRSILPGRYRQSR